ncbi:hypothetical protein BCV69DRAFT_281931 [Microstroma glucosiphilum]|uniref:histone acetyltransferase n=1 Tax=Pseudomicrostroma glucosiphilum TaxID=1684307 RepID=A0A316U9W2_9BASI|nr:hypothetical protein BCV69DRAFT_281931 [Pseudomicrostroma glucosiphilum]PWN22020.1 hypothetical protein BCV69DRAFT_281931 [Pseudomicrostroma glucosiphilum]
MEDHTEEALPSPLCPELPSQPLLAHLTHAASTIPRSALPAGKGHLVLSVIFSPPRPTKQLYPWAHLDEPREVAQGFRPFPTHTVQTWEEMVFFHAEWRRDDEHEDDAKMIMAIEGYHYTLPEHASAVFYLSKLDTTGWGPRLNHPSVRRQLASFELQGRDRQASPSTSTSTSTGESQLDVSSITGHLTEQFLAYFMSLRHMPRLAVDCLPPRHISLHILARAQAAYIFPNSPDNPLKKPLGDAKLIVWWRQVLSKVVELVRRAERQESEQGKRIDAFYMVPGMDKLESHPLIALPHLSHDAAVKKVGWKYGHPYTATGGGSDPSSADLPPLPLFPDSSARSAQSQDPNLPPAKSRSIATLMPRFEDDPQSRFLDELANEGQEFAAFADLLKRSDSGASTATAVSNGAPAAVAMSSRSSSSTTSSSAHSSQTIVAEGSGSEDGLSGWKGERSGYESSSLPQTPSKRMKRTRSGADSPYNIAEDLPTSPSRGGSPTPTRASPRLREKEAQRSPSKSPVKTTSISTRMSPTKMHSPRKRSRLGSSASATDLPFAPVASKSNGEVNGSHVTSLPTAAAMVASTSNGNGNGHAHGPRLTQAQLSSLRSRLSLDSVSADEFWMRMGFRQECSSGSLVGCFFLGFTRPAVTNSSSSSAAPPLGESHLVPPQPRPRFTIPMRELQRTMRNELQLDDCNWHLPRDSIELTQYFDEERGRLLAHAGRLHPEEKDEERLRLLRGARRTRATVKGELVVEGGEKMKKVSKKHGKRNNADEDWIWRVGEGIVWNSVPLLGFSEGQVEEAKRKVGESKNAGGGGGDGAMGVGVGVGESGESKPVVTMLSVKRKKKT